MRSLVRRAVVTPSTQQYEFAAFRDFDALTDTARRQQAADGIDAIDLLSEVNNAPGDQALHDFDGAFQAAFAGIREL